MVRWVWLSACWAVRSRLSSCSNPSACGTHASPVAAAADASEPSAMRREVSRAQKDSGQNI